MVTRTLRSTFTGSFAALAVAGGLVFATAVPSQAAEVQVAADAGVSVQTIANERQALAAQAAHARGLPDTEAALPRDMLDED